MNPEYMSGVIILTAMSVLLAAVLCCIRCGTVRIYNWDGKKYRYLGRAGLRRSGGGYVVRLRERMADLSYTTLYQICPTKRFVRRNRYREMAFLAGKVRCLLYVDGCMRQSVYYRR